MSSTGPVPAVWHDGKSAAAHQAILFYRPHKRQLRLCAPGSLNDMAALSVWDLRSTRLLSGGAPVSAAEPLRLGLEGSGERLILTNPEAAATVREWLRAPLAENRSRGRRRWLLGGMAIWALCLSLYFSGNALFSALAGMLPQSWETAWGRTARHELVQTLREMSAAGVRGECPEGTRSAALAALVKRLTEAAPLKGYTCDILVLDADLVNAFALPGGVMLITTGLIRFCRTPEELAGVIAHEMAHVSERHGLGRLLRQTAWRRIVGMLGWGDVAGGVPLALLTSSLDRDDERRADSLGALRLRQAGIDPAGMADFFDRLSRKEGGNTGNTGLLRYFASHPGLGERVADIRRRQGGDNEAASRRPALSPAEWQALRGVCEQPARNP
jgi:Zn-dependent protease with chaperone function